VRSRIFTATYGVRLLLPSLKKRDPASARVSTLVSWCGMRGVVSLAAALAIPWRCRMAIRFRIAIS
jgi:NhaP-type Na+/H+ or K+/H+ antiporter